MAASADRKRKLCGICKDIIFRNQNEVLCGGICQMWFHTECVDISAEDYLRLRSAFTIKGVNWSCPPCSELLAPRNFRNIQRYIDKLNKSVKDLRNDNVAIKEKLDLVFAAVTQVPKSERTPTKDAVNNKFYEPLSDQGVGYHKGPKRRERAKKVNECNESIYITPSHEIYNEKLTNSWDYVLINEEDKTYSEFIPLKTRSLPSYPLRPSQRPVFNGGRFAQQCLDRHNEFRAMHQVGPLKLNSELSAFAQEWANRLACMQTLTHRTNNKYGENLWMNMTTDRNHQVHGGDAVDNWYKDELQFYTFGTEPNDLKAGHLTQVLWAGSKRLGVGVSKIGYYTFVVCNYDPPGNYRGRYAENVPPVGAQKPREKSKRFSSSSYSQVDFIKDTLKMHNNYRARHGVPPLILRDNISRYAQSWADQLARRDLFQHRPDNSYGENLFMCNGKASAKEMCEAWYGEGAGYNYGEDPVLSGAGLKSGHFTQMVWRETRYVGVGRAFTEKGAMIGVVNYFPPGNFVGQFTANVTPARFFNL